MLVTAVYDAAGKILKVDMQGVKEVSAGASKIGLSLPSNNASGIQTFTVKAFFLTADGTMLPQTEVLFETTVSAVLLSVE